MNKHLLEFIGEFIGTFIIVFFGCGSVISATLFESFDGLFQVAFVWIIGVTLAIYASRRYSNAHLNPAVSIAMVVAGKMRLKHLPHYLLGQFLGAFVSAGILYLIYGGFITDYELTHQIVRGDANSVLTASMFGEFFPNPGFSGIIKSASEWQAFGAEFSGTFILVYMIFWLIHPKNESQYTPLLIGMTVGGLICLLAPISQGGFNPARDFGPRLFSYFAGWGDAAFPTPSFSFLTVYILGPIIGGIVAALFFKLFHREKVT
jgi:glycerol uptake facilitator protein